jgi:hypothetical protein
MSIFQRSKKAKPAEAAPAPLPAAPLVGARGEVRGAAVALPTETTNQPEPPAALTAKETTMSNATEPAMTAGEAGAVLVTKYRFLPNKKDPSKYWVSCSYLDLISGEYFPDVFGEHNSKLPTSLPTPCLATLDCRPSQGPNGLSLRPVSCSAWTGKFDLLGHLKDIPLPNHA